MRICRKIYAARVMGHFPADNVGLIVRGDSCLTSLLKVSDQQTAIFINAQMSNTERGGGGYSYLDKAFFTWVLKAGLPLIL